MNKPAFLNPVLWESITRQFPAQEGSRTVAVMEVEPCPDYEHKMSTLALGICRNCNGTGWVLK